jgi:hypothetical protein
VGYCKAPQREHRKTLGQFLRLRMTFLVEVNPGPPAIDPSRARFSVPD